MNSFAWKPATSVRDAAETATAITAETMTGAIEGPAAIVKAGGIDLLDLMKERLLTPTSLIDLHSVPGLDTVTQDTDGSVRIGAMTTLAELAGHSLIRRYYPALADAAGTSASPQIRNVATLGGNLLQRPRCWYFRSAAYHCLRKGGSHCFALDGENQYHAIFSNRPCAIVHPSTTATVLVALDAAIVLAGPDEVRRVALRDFFVASDRDIHRENDLRPHEILTEIMLSPVTGGTRMAHLRYSEKQAFDWPLADVAVRLELASDGVCKTARVVLGAAAPIPHRAESAAAILIGKRIDGNVAAAAARAALDGATPLSDNAYKLPLFETLVRRALLKAIEPQQP
jgi:xanthine dehydrogenase YagS FAD-binding subunit